MKIPKNVKFLGLTSLFNDIASDIIAPVLPIFLTGVLHATTAFVGLIEGVAESTASLLKLFSGMISDRARTRKPLVIAGYAVSTAARPLLSAVGAGWQVLSLRFLDRVGKGIRTSG
ncbi:MAG: MFS transporter, partial [Deltaproteobacteria bacterium]|nr:MFS transporter [Deltaproteobacteria bacterium]